MHRLKSVVWASVAMLSLAACSGGAAETTTSAAITTLPPVTTTTAAPTTSSSSTSTTTSPTTTTTMPAPEHPSPLNGLGVDDPALLERRAIAVKIDNHPEARPQSGLQEADMVYELLVEGGLTRFIAVFHSSDSEYVGPIRSLRPTDPTLVTYLGAPLQISGGQDWIQSLASGLGLKMLGENGISTFRIGSRRAPHNLYGKTAGMRDLADGRNLGDDAPEPIFTFGEGTPPLVPATEVTLDWSDRPEVVWRWDEESSTYLRFNRSTPHEWIAADGERGQVSTETLLVLTARLYTAAPTTGQGSAVPALTTKGTGQALMFHNGKVLQGTWERESYDDPFTLKLISGAEMVLPRGKLWIAVFPSTGSVDFE